MTLTEQSIADLKAIMSKRNPNNFNIIFFGDSWVNSGKVSDNIFQAAMERAMDFNPLLFCHGGDIVYSGIAENLNKFIELLNRFNKDKKGNRVPFFVVPGNHDAVLNQTTNTLSFENYKRIIGPPSMHWYVDLPAFKFRLVGLNTMYHNIYQQYGLTETELNFLRDKLLSQHRRNSFVAMHVPPREPQLDWVADDSFPNGRGRREFYNIVKGNVSEVLVSHIHDFQLAEAHDVDFVLSGGGGATLNVGALFHIVVINIQNHGNHSVVTPIFVPVGWNRASEPVSP